MGTGIGFLINKFSRIPKYSFYLFIYFFQLLRKAQLAGYRNAGCGPASSRWPCIKPESLQSADIKPTAVRSKARLWLFSRLSSGAADSGDLLGPSPAPHSRFGEVSHFCVLTETYAYFHSITNHNRFYWLFNCLYLPKSRKGCFYV